MMHLRNLLLAVACISALWLPAVPAAAQEGKMLRVPTQGSAYIPVFWVKQNKTPITVVLFSGGGGGIGKLDASGWPGSDNFLIRSGKLFAAAGFNIAMVAKPSDVPRLDPDLRIGEGYVDDLYKTLQYIKTLSNAPIWLVGTSQGTISATALAIAHQDPNLIAGVVLTSSVTSSKWRGSVPRQALDKLKVPVLVVHHAKDACRVCRPDEVPAIMKGLKNAPVKKLVIVDGGSGATGDPCEALHYHGYIGMEREVVDLISAWIKAPSN